MNEGLASVSLWLLSWAAGSLLGAAFFGGLWWTVRKVVSVKHPALWVLGSLWLRLAATVAGFYFVAGGHWQRLAACTLGFLCARLFATRLAHAAQEANHAP